MKLKHIIIIISVVLGTIACFWGYKLYESIGSRVQEIKYIEETEEKIKTQLVLLKDLQTAYRNEKKHYAENWGNLSKFIQSDSIYTIDKHEHIINLYPGKDSSYYTYDTIHITSVKDSIFNKNTLKLNIKNYTKLPHKANMNYKITLGRVDGVAVFEIKNTKPVHPKRELGIYDTLRIGSLRRVTEEGNWEK